jgi:hypothetical protein
MIKHWWIAGVLVLTLSIAFIGCGGNSKAKPGPVTPTTPASPNPGILETMADAHIEYGSAQAIPPGDLQDSNFGSANALEIRKQSGSTALHRTKKGYLKFSVAGVNASAIAKARLEFTTTAAPLQTWIRIYGLKPEYDSPAWNESEITWNNAPANDKAGGYVALEKVYGGDYLARVQNVTPGVYTVDVTDYLKSLTSDNATFILTGEAVGSSSDLILSREGAAQPGETRNGPRLLLEYIDGSQPGPRPYPTPIPGRFIHPGILNGQYDLDYMKNAVSGTGTHPMRTGYQQMLETSNASLSYTPKAFADVKVVSYGSSESEERFRDDAHAAYAHALNWVITGDPRYKNKSIEILNTWANTCISISVDAGTDTSQTILEAAWALPIWVSAAEIIRHYNNGSAGWPTTEINKFKSFVTMMMSYVDGPFKSVDNWIASRALARMAAGVFLDDWDLYNRGYAEADTQISRIGSDGKPSENERDSTHSQYNVIATSQAAEVAFHQGNNGLYLKRLPGETTSVPPLLLRQSEYYVRELMGNPPPGGVNYASKNSHCPPYEMILACYKYDFAMSTPYTEQFVTQYNRPTDIKENHFVGWTTLTHAR